MVRNSVARPARIPTIHTVVLLITWPMDAAASRCPAARPGTARAAGGCQGGSGGMRFMGGVPPGSAFGMRGRPAGGRGT